ncbi:MAG: cytochrome c [Acidobacteria bacterium]|nr:MAG: cytochrome c [Acidobacteriota bacterium]
MHDQPRHEPLEASSLFADGRSSRPLIEGTVARGQLRENRELYTGLDAAGQFVSDLPAPVTRELLERGRSRFNAFCSPCHGRRGDGGGMVVQRGFKQPQSFHQVRLRDTPVGYYYDVISRGFGEMSSYAAQLSPQDRWAIVAYIRALQVSRNVPVAELTADERRQLEELASKVPGAPETVEHE